MLENSVGYKGPIPRISYSRYFNIDKVKVTSAADEKVCLETGSPFSKLFYAKDERKLCDCDKIERRKVTRIEKDEKKLCDCDKIERRKVTRIEKDEKKLCDCDKIERRKVARIELLKYGAPGCTGCKNDVRKMTHLSPPPQRFQTTTGNMSSHEKPARGNSRTEPKPCSVLECYRELCSCRDFALSSDRVWLHFDNESVDMKQRGKSENTDKRPSNRDIDEETQREKIINSWMQFFG